ncbi:chitin deacetylase [Basidiobolus ranarum]|uniref:Chitin deacetylase n=1 Tax=Basidiobolus ranarum TaxID=34480 RepID=A0ABR2WLH2_9FUNG
MDKDLRIWNPIKDLGVMHYVFFLSWLRFGDYVTQPEDCENYWETCGNCALPDDIYGCQARQWALTFDDGSSQYTAQLLDMLAAANVKATFQMIGANVIQFPDVVKRAYDEGHQIASHTRSHPHLMSLSNEQIVAEVKTTEDTLFNITGARPAYICPPYGEADDRVKAIFKAMGYHTLLWNMDTLDWDIPEKNEDASLILDSFKTALTKGTDLNAHNDPGTTNATNGDDDTSSNDDSVSADRSEDTEDDSDASSNAEDDSDVSSDSEVDSNASSDVEDDSDASSDAEDDSNASDNTETDTESPATLKKRGFNEFSTQTSNASTYSFSSLLFISICSYYLLG